MAKDQDSFELAVAIQALTARHEVLSIALQEALRTLTPDQADHCAAAIRSRVEALVAAAPTLAMPVADEALAQELSRFLGALGPLQRTDLCCAVAERCCRVTAAETHGFSVGPTPLPLYDIEPNSDFGQSATRDAKTLD